MAIGSSGPKENVQVVQDCVPNGHLISATVNGLEVHRGKPDPEVFLAAAGKLGIEPRRCAVVEDAVVGVDAARRANMLSIGLLGTAARAALEVYAHWVVASLREVNPKLIAERIEGRHIA
jgi:beta-phosphoglucomutase